MVVLRARARIPILSDGPFSMLPLRVDYSDGVGFEFRAEDWGEFQSPGFPKKRSINHWVID